MGKILALTMLRLLRSSLPPVDCLPWEGGHSTATCMGAEGRQGAGNSAQAISLLTPTGHRLPL